MANESDVWVFSADEAEQVAQVVVDYDPATPRTQKLVPRNVQAASRGARHLTAQLKRLPKSILSSLEGAETSAGQLSDDRLQGLAELIQNADDLGATHAYFAVDEVNSRLLFAHNGAGLTLHDVWALAIPWLSLKTTEDEMLGRFGIGLKTLHSLSETLEVYEGNFRLRLVAQTIEPLDDTISWPGAHPLPGGTVFAVPFDNDAVTTSYVAAWLTQWGEAGLVFLRNLGTVKLLDAGGAEVETLRLDRGPFEDVGLGSGTAQRRSVTAPDGRHWVVYVRRAPAPAGRKRARKAQAALTPVALAFPRFDGDAGHLHVGLPVRRIGFPFRVLAQFDPLANRRDISDSDWNMGLVPAVAQLWRDAALDLFNLDAGAAWSAVPLAAEFSDDDRTTGRLRDSLETHLMTAARLSFAEDLRLDGGRGEELPLHQLAYEVPELEGIVEPADVEQVAETAGTVILSARSVDDRWRDVLDELEDLGAKAPLVVGVSDALVLLEDKGRSPRSVADLTAVALGADLASRLSELPCVVLDDESHVVPDEQAPLDVLLPKRAGELWDTLGMGSRLHPEYRASKQWKVLRDWMQDEDLRLVDASDQAALRVLAETGESGSYLMDPLSDAQLSAVRAALETVDESWRGRLGRGIGKAVLLDAFSFDTSDERIVTYARPCDAYLIENEANTWFTAAGHAPGLVWLHRRYAKDLRAPSGREGLGPQRLFRLLGAETAPRVIPHPDTHKRYSYYAAGVRQYAEGSPVRRIKLLSQHHATYTVEDYASPDLDAVLNDIAAEKDPSRRRKRATSVLATLSRAWGRLEELATTKAVSEDHGWVERGEVEAWWLSSAASIPWLTAEKGKPAPPGELRIKTSSTVTLYGDDPERYLAPAFATAAHTDVLLALGVAGDAGVSELMAKLREIRSETRDDPVRGADLAARVYRELAYHLRGSGSSRTLGTLTRTSAIAAFAHDTGLIATNLGWLRPSVVLSGPPIFRDRRAFTPSVPGAEPLWTFLGIRRPNADDARGVLRQLAKVKRLDVEDEMVMLDCFRVLAAGPPTQLGVLRRTPLWVGDRWVAKRPVFAVSNPLIADALADKLPIWTPGGALSQVESLVEPLGLTRLDSSQATVLDAVDAIYDADLTNVFVRAVTNLRADLAMSDAFAEASLVCSWDDLAQVRVCLLPEIHVELPDPSRGTPLSLDVDAWLDLGSRTFLVVDASKVGWPTSGAYAVASAFTGDSRRIAHDWLAAWSTAFAGDEAEAAASAVSTDANLKRQRAETAEVKLREFAEHTKQLRKKSSSKLPKPTTSSGDGGSKSTPAAKVHAPRLLVDTDALALTNENGEIVGGSGSGSKATRGKAAKKSRPKLNEPDLTKTSKPSGGAGRGPTNYTEREKEDAGMELVRKVLGSDLKGVPDIRNQHNVGADAVDELRNFYELKAHAGAIPDVVRLQNSQVQRALQPGGKFFLVVVGNLEQGGPEPEVRIITDPFDHLNVEDSGHVTVSGVQSAHSLRYTFSSTGPAVTENQTPQPRTNRTSS